MKPAETLKQQKRDILRKNSFLYIALIYGMLLILQTQIFFIQKYEIELKIFCLEAYPK